MSKKKSDGEVFGSSGGKTTLKKYGREHYQKIAAKRWRKWRKERSLAK